MDVDGDGDGDVLDKQYFAADADNWACSASRSSTSIAVRWNSLRSRSRCPRRRREETRPWLTSSSVLQRQFRIAEAAGRTGAADAARTYAIARGSAMECAAILDALGTLKIIDPARRQRGLELLERIVAMLTKLCR